MKRLAFLLLVALASAAVTYFLVGLQSTAYESARPGDLGWIKSEFDLTDEQFATVRQLHDEYSGQCAQHCAAIVAARQALAAVPPDATAEQRDAARARVAELEAVCNEATRAHLSRVAAAMPPEVGERFRRTIEPHLAQLPHDGERGFRR